MEQITLCPGGICSRFAPIIVEYGFVHATVN